MCTFSLRTPPVAECCLHLHIIQSTVITLLLFCFLFFVFVFFTDVFARAWRPMASYIDECIDNEHHLKKTCMHNQPQFLCK